MTKGWVWSGTKGVLRTSRQDVTYHAGNPKAVSIGETIS
jgi:hypothetical protein